MAKTTVKWSPVNQAYFLMFGHSVINIFNSEADLMSHLQCNGLKLKGNVVVSAR